VKDSGQHLSLEYLQSTEIIDIGLESLRGKLTMDKDKMQCDLFLSTLFIKNSESKSLKFKHILANPKLENI
jgi:hypothetical protein